MMRLTHYRAIGPSLPLFATLSLSSCVPPPAPLPEPRPGHVGLLVMAHGGAPEWNATVEAAVAPLRGTLPVAIAFGMAKRETLEQGVRTLERQGVTRITVVRLFVSGDSFLHRTEYLLGLRPDPPAGPEAGSPIPISTEIAISREGLVDSPLMAQVLIERTRSLSADPGAESVLILAHGAEDDDANHELMRKIDRLAHAVRRDEGYREVRVETLREDWEEKRAAAETRIRGFVKEASDTGRALVVPFRLSGFGPYEEVLEGLEYAADGRGLLPHPAVTDWIRSQAEALRSPEGPVAR